MNIASPQGEKPTEPIRRFNLNRSTKIGNVVADPVRRKMPSGSYITNFSIGVNTWYYDQHGRMREHKPQFYNIIINNERVGMRVINTIKKGELVFVEGPDRLRRWKKANGYWTADVEIIAEKVFPMTMAGATDMQFEDPEYMEASEVDAWELNREQV